MSDMTYQRMCADYADGLLLQLADLWYCKMTEQPQPEPAPVEEPGFDDED